VHLVPLRGRLDVDGTYRQALAQQIGDEVSPDEATASCDQDIYRTAGHPHLQCIDWVGVPSTPPPCSKLNDDLLATSRSGSHTLAAVASALITGVAGQDGIYLARKLLAQGVRVVGTVNPRSPWSEREQAYLDGVAVERVDLTDHEGLRGLIRRETPDLVFNLAGMSSVARSWAEPEAAQALNAQPVEVLLQALCRLRDESGREVRFVQASTGEVGVGTSPYALSKERAEEFVRAARDRDGLHASIARLHIHDSPVRPATFVTRKITAGVAAIALGRAGSLTLGNLDVVRDWGFAGDYVEALVRMAAAPEPLELPVGTGVAHDLAEVVALAFAAVEIDDSTRYVVQDPALMRPADIPALVADPRPARESIGWEPQVGLAELIGHMVEVDLARARTGVGESARYLFAPATAARSGESRG